MNKHNHKRFKSHHSDQEYADALSSMKEIILRDGHSVFKSAKEDNELERMQIEERLQRMRVKRSSSVFVDKLKRTIQYGNPVRRFFISGLDGYVFHSRKKGLVFPEKLHSLILITNLICLVVLLFLATFLAFLDDFSENYA